MDDGTDGWMKKASRKTTRTSFTICNKFVKLAAEVFPPVQMLLGRTHCCHIAFMFLDPWSNP
jgi:hypothetical protein